MSTQSVTVVDYGAGNISSVARALESGGASVRLASTSQALRQAGPIVLPGVGAFKQCVSLLQNLDLFDEIQLCVNRGKPLLGICVGMQMLFEQGTEFGNTEGLGLLNGAVEQLKVTGAKLPHIGWAPLGRNERSWKGTILDAEPLEASVYFLHSFAAAIDLETTVAVTNYGGARINAVSKKENVTGTQFHPERSGVVGLSMLRTWINSAR